MTDLITVTVFHEEQLHYGIPTNAIEFMEFWQSKLDLIPEEFRGSAEIKAYLRAPKLHSIYTVVVDYKRPKTDLDRAREEQMEAKYAAKREATERRTLAKLLAKYPQ